MKASGELKTKPTQHSVKELRSLGIQPDIIICRSERKIPKAERKKISLFCNVQINNVIETVDVRTIYEAPISFHKEKLDDQVLSYFGIKNFKKPNLSKWKNITDKVVVMTNGKIVESGLSNEVFDYPKQKYTKKLLSAALRYASD